MSSALTRPIRGIVTPMITPLIDPDTVDFGSLERLIDRLIRGRVSGIFVLGSTGEAPGLTSEQREQVIDQSCGAVGGRVPVLVGITDTVAAGSLRTAEYAARAGAQALVLSPPYYFGLSNGEFLRYLERLTPRLPLPVYLYNMPFYTKLVMGPEMVRAAASLPNVVGLKDSSGDLEYFAAVRAAVADPEFALLVGVEEKLAAGIHVGAHGGVCGGSNLWPELYVEVCERAVSGDAVRGEELHQTVMRISEGVYHFSPDSSSYLRGLKAAASILGFGTGAMAEPYEALDAAGRERIRRCLEQSGVPFGARAASAL